MTSRFVLALCVFALAGCGTLPSETIDTPRTDEVRLMTVDPGHFHAALLQKRMLPNVSPHAYVYAPLGPDLTDHLDRITQFNTRPDGPTAWQLDIRAGGDWFQRMLAESPGNTVVLSGKNRHKIDQIHGAVEAGLHVLADKPWIIEASDIARLRTTLDAAESAGVVAYDAMTQRFEITFLLQKELVNDPDVFGGHTPGTESEPAVRLESTHYLYKLVAGVPNRRPPWYFDIHEQGEGLTDVGTHLVDLVQWTLFPEMGLDYRNDIEILSAKRWPTVISEDDFRKVTGAPGFPDYLKDHVKDGSLEYFCNNSVSYTLRGTHVRLDIKWEFQAAPGVQGSSLASYQGGRSSIEVRQGSKENSRPKVYVIPNSPAEQAAVKEALQRKVKQLQSEYPGVALEEHGGVFGIVIPDALRVGHEAHFALLTNKFFEYLRDPDFLPSYEKANMLAKYYVTTAGVEMARQASGGSGR